MYARAISISRLPVRDDTEQSLLPKSKRRARQRSSPTRQVRSSREQPACRCPCSSRPAILVPLPIATDDHQAANTREVVAAGGARMMRQKGFKPAELARQIEAMALQPGALANAARRALSVGRPNASRALADLALRLEDAGAGWLTLHPRTARQGFGGTAQWDAIASLAQRLSIPLLASGDLFTAADGIACLESTGASGLMYARGAMHNPAIFADHATLLAGSPVEQADGPRLRAMISRHLRLARAHCPGKAALWKMRSVVPRYVRTLPGARALRQELCHCSDWEEPTRFI